MILCEHEPKGKQSKDYVLVVWDFFLWFLKNVLKQCGDEQTYWYHKLPD